MSNNLQGPNDATLQNSAGATGNGTVLNVGGLAGIMLEVTGGASATALAEVTVGGSTWTALQLVNMNTGAVIAAATGITANGLYFVSFSGADQFRARISSYTSGNMTIVAKAVAVAPAMALLALQSANSLGTVNQGTAAAAANAWQVQVGDAAGGHTMPALDAKARKGWVQPTDGTNDFLSASAANLAAQSSINSQLIARPGEWAVQNSPAVGTLASASKTAGGAGVRHVCTGISFAWASDGTANGAAQNVTVVIRDGATGAGTILGQWTLARTTTTAADAANAGQFSLTGLNLVGSTATAMTAEFTGTGSTHELYTANLFGYDAV